MYAYILYSSRSVQLYTFNPESSIVGELWYYRRFKYPRSEGEKIGQLLAGRLSILKSCLSRRRRGTKGELISEHSCSAK